MLTYGTGSETVEVSDDGSMLVKQGDTLGRYSMIMYKDYKNFHQYKRMGPDGSLIDIVNVNLIYSGETLYHKPDYDRANRPISTTPAATPAPPTAPVYSPPPPGSGFMRFLGAEIIAQDNYDTVGFLEGITTIGEVVFTDVASFASGVLTKLGGSQLSLLHVQAHGHPSGIQWGPTDWVSPGTFSTHLPHFNQLKGRFHSDAWLDLRCCLIGQNLQLLRLFRDLWRINVIAGTGLQNNLLDMNRAHYQVVAASGAEYTTVFAPPWVRYDVERRFAREFINMF